MRVGIFLSAQFDPDTDPSAGLAAITEQAVLADRLGFDTVYLGHHYLAHSAFLQPLQLAGYLAHATERVRIGFGVLLAPLHNPIALAEELATLDVLSGGRITVGLGAGYRKRECAAFGVEWGDRIRRLREYVPLLRALWAGEKVTAEGSWGKVENAHLALRPVQAGGPPLWIGAFADPAIKRAARLDAPWLMGPEGGEEAIAERLALYRDELRAHGHSLDRAYPMSREACVAPTTEGAVALVRPHLERQYSGYKSWDTAQGIDVDRYIAEDCLVGDPARVVERIRGLERVHGITHLSLRLQFMGMPHDQAMAQIRRFGEEVLPHVG
ncbi:alkanesulfonate monooxygenase SsuD/methylene tetrahydromethanopterin reductase-like flavin-dependent oxidoreductase (luciferase family) [Actinocorallia herbida]|uniref:Alkanesulfonate monooxygenase SsuD/methylene tetrahydromethanopterin reductase-like flavin-dependent oxidoreductase (Luciferase family) n=1 Tax=Actinocorallia herbida TaxID=58109 RepID=A0A3N1CX25_9ACTN|nr:LLM class flavin-dependent oxidoreductase [Actinocorallia herbida]ROO85814.1 alkanesulfonate monooxygenase SsuD/methylene tetrahydromethanopterin reductase-like flavin-dependent oxidoreductase (luciferase family) [Actinocorallia herbida]